MTIERAIEHAKLVASEQMMRAGKCTSHDKYCDKFSSCVKCAEEHKQLAQWLEELKEYKELEEKLCVIFAWDCSLSDVVENLERQITEPDKDHPLNARILTYEDAEKWNEYMELEDQGLLVRLPCKVGTKVYAISSFFDCIYNYEHCKDTQEWKCEEDIHCEYEKRLHYVKEIKFCLTLKSAIGKTVFLTREEAEKKLEEMKGDHDAGRNHY